MSLILNIDTATEVAHISIAKDGRILKDMFNTNQKNHAAFLQPAILRLMGQTGITFAELDAIAVTKGPGSYTGLRIAMASAKGLCYALNKPLITIDSLELMAKSAFIKLHERISNKSSLLCPMVDARRLEVFTSLYDWSLNNILPPCAMVLDEKSFSNFFNISFIIFFGSGIKKWEAICSNKKASFQQIEILPEAMSIMSQSEFELKNFSNIAYSEPAYIKDFYTK